MLKRIHYRWVSLPIALDWDINKQIFDCTTLNDLFQIDPNCFANKPNLKMIDELALKFYSRSNITKLYNYATEEKYFKLLLYFILIYPFTGLFMNT